MLRDSKVLVLIRIIETIGTNFALRTDMVLRITYFVLNRLRQNLRHLDVIARKFSEFGSKTY